MREFRAYRRFLTVLNEITLRRLYVGRWSPIHPRGTGNQLRDVRQVALLNQRIEHIEGSTVESNDQEFIAHTLGLTKA
jgi:hypothetical protein